MKRSAKTKHVPNGASSGRRRGAARHGEVHAWRQKSAARLQLELAIEDALDAGLPRAYTPEIDKQKCSTVFERAYESYPEQDVGVYAAGG